MMLFRALIVNLGYLWFHLLFCEACWIVINFRLISLYNKHENYNVTQIFSCL